MINHNENAVQKMSLKNNELWNRLYVIVILVSSSFYLNSQIIFHETFSGTDGITSGTANGVDWSSSCPDCVSGDYWEVKSGVFEGRDTNGEAEWITVTPIDISNCGNIEISFDIESAGTMEGCGTNCNSVDWVRFQYNIDGAGWVDPNNSYFCSGDCASIPVIASDDVPFTTYSTGCIPTNGSNLKLRIAVQCWSNDEYWRIDNVKVICSSPDAGTNETLNTCLSSNPSNLFDELGGTPISGGTWSGPSNLTGGHLGTFDPTSMNPGLYTYTVGISPCQSSSSVTVNITSPGAAGDDNLVELCMNSNPLSLFNQLGGIPDINGTWNGPSSLTGGDQGIFNPITMLEGVYTYTVGTSPCETSAEIKVVFNGPTASFTANPIFLNVDNTLVTFTNQSLNATSYLWDFGDNSALSTDVHPTHYFPDLEPGTYTITLTAFNPDNCSSTHSESIFIAAPEMSYEIPNIFTPNGDGSNDFYKLVDVQNVSEIEVTILSRWGNVVFTSESVDFQWNGALNNTGASCTEGTYFYKIDLTDLNGEVVKEHGFVQLSK